jgi:hypothetical protein
LGFIGKAGTMIIPKDAMAMSKGSKTLKQDWKTRQNSIDKEQFSLEK